MSRVIVIPARLASSRLPNKPLLDIAGLPLVEHVRRRCLRVPRVSRVVVAAEDQAIVDAVRAFGGEAALTPPVASGTDRVATVLEPDWPSVVNVQGDMPTIEPAVVARLFEALEAGAALATLAAPFPGAPPTDEAIVKVAADASGKALDFVRTADDLTLSWQHHIGVYGYSRDALTRFVALPPGRRERAERLEQLRWLEAGGSIQVVTVASVAEGIDTPVQLQALRARFLSGALQAPDLPGDHHA